MFCSPATESPDMLLDLLAKVSVSCPDFLTEKQHYIKIFKPRTSYGVILSGVSFFIKVKSL